MFATNNPVDKSTPNAMQDVYGALAVLQKAADKFATLVGVLEIAGQYHTKKDIVVDDGPVGPRPDAVRRGGQCSATQG